MRHLYSIAWWLLILPLALLRLWWRGRKEPGYRKHISERLASYGSAPGLSDCIWVHAVSVGETRAAEPLVDALLKTCPDRKILLTCMTPTGRETGKELFGREGRVIRAFLPYDTGLMMNRFIRHFNPAICILMETEIWPNLLAACARHNIPVALVNARLSQRSLEKGKRMASLMEEAAAGITCVAAQTETDAERLRQFGGQHVIVAGSVKFDVHAPDDAVQKGQRLRKLIGARPVLMCASTRDGEEALILDAFESRHPPETLLLLVPRHPQRFEEVAETVAARNLGMQRRSRLGETLETAPAIPSGTRVLLGDSMGEMFAYYEACDIAFIGGSLKPLGGQNLIEACALGKPVIIGPHTFNFEAISEDAVSSGCALRVHSAAELMEKAGQLLSDREKRESMGMAARQFAIRQRGATGRTIEMLRPFLGC